MQSLKDMLGYRHSIKLSTILLFLIVLILAETVYWKLEKRNHPIARAVLPEEVVFARSDDDVLNGGVLCSPDHNKTNSEIAIIWIHGWGVNFYSPSYVNIGRAFSARGFACIIGNTRMHDLGNIQGYKFGKRVRGGGYWGIASKEVDDIAAWIDLTESFGFKKVILVGHSAGWSAVRRYQSERQDARVIGIVSASGSLYPDTRPVDTVQLVQALRSMEKSDGEDLIKDPKRSFPSYISAATFMDIVNQPPQYKDFFGFNYAEPGVTKIECPVLAFFGTDGDVGDEKELESLATVIKKQSHLKCTVTTQVIKDADHMYDGEEEQVVDEIIGWINGISTR